MHTICYTENMETDKLIQKLRKKRMLLKLNSLLKTQTSDIWLVGGCIRDTFLGIKTNDYDIAVTKNAYDLSRFLAKKLKGNPFPLDRKMGEFRIMLPRKRTIDIKPIEEITEDMKERDFTINAIAFNLKDLKRLYDPFNGIRDLKRKSIVPINNLVFIKDSLRILRMFRFASTRSFTISKKAMELAKESVKKIDKVANERVRTEFFLLMENQKSYFYLKKMDSIGLIAELFPEVEKGKSIPQSKYRSKNLKEHLFVCYDIMEKIIEEKRYRVFEDFVPLFEKFINKHLVMLKLAALLHDIGKIYTMKKDASGATHFYMHEKKGELRLKRYYQHRFSLSNKEVEILSLLILHHMRASLLSRVDRITDHALYRFMKDGKEAIPGILLLSYADCISSSGGGKEVRKAEKTIRTIIEYYAVSIKVKARKKLITGYDLIEKFGLEPGPLFKTILEKVEKANIEGKIKNKKETFRFVKEILARSQKKIL